MGPFLKLKNKKHILWYAHTSKPLSLVFAYKFVDSLITSTQGSCPLSGSKVKFIGQSIDTNTFQFVEKERKDLRKFVHLGRFDRSKKIDLIISNFSKFLDFKKDLSLTIIGTPSKKTSMEYKDKLFEKYSSLIISRSLVFLPAVNRRSLPSVLSNYDLFLHAYQGSLDKVILEATLVGLPVITLNQEYLAIFGTWSKVQPKKVTLELEINSILKLSMSEIGIVLKKRHEIASTDHSLNQWITKVEGILNS
jgi:glycosyltransferase involved in cell wall biosynthesis